MEQLHYLNLMAKKDQVIAYEKFFHGDPENENKVSAIERFLKPVEDNLYDHALERFDIGGVVGNDCHSFALKTSTYNGQIGFATFNLGIAFTAKSLAGSTLVQAAMLSAKKLPLKKTKSVNKLHSSVVFQPVGSYLLY